MKDLDKDRIARKLKNAPRLSNEEVLIRRRQGLVYAATGGSIDVILGDGTEVIEDVPYMGTYTPQVGDVVWVDIKDGDFIVVGAQDPAFNRPLKTFGTWTAQTTMTTAQPGETVASVTVAAQPWQQFVDLYAMVNLYVNAANGQARVAWYKDGPTGTMLTPTRINAKNLAAGGNEQLIVQASTTLASDTACTFTLQIWPTTVTSWTTFVDGNYQTAYAISQKA